MQVQRHQMDFVLFFTVVLLTAAGIITVYSASTLVAIQQYNVPGDFFAKKQLISGVIGLVVMFGISWLPHRMWYKWTLAVMALSLSLLVLVLVPHIGTAQNGGQRWIGSGSLHLQPSELAIIAIVVYLAFFFTKKVTLIHSVKQGLVPALIVVAINFILIFGEPDMGTAMTLLGTSLVVIFASGARVKPLAILMAILIPLLVFLASVASYRSNRLAAWLHPFKHAHDISYQLVQGMTGIAAGGWFGSGFDHSIEKAGYLPYPQTDFIFPVFVEEWGLVGALALLIALGIVVWRGFRIARRSPDRFGSLLCVGLTSQIVISSFINLGAVTGLIPVTGIPLPFISYGGTDLIVNMASMGILLGISRVALSEEPEEDQLADIVSAEDVAELRKIRTASTRPAIIGIELKPVKKRERPVRTGHAEVHRLQPRKHQTPPKTTWRSRKQVATNPPVRPAANADKARPSSSKTTAQPPKTWRDRQANGNDWRPAESNTKKSKRPSRKER